MLSILLLVEEVVEEQLDQQELTMEAAVVVPVVIEQRHQRDQVAAERLKALFQCLLALIQ